MFGIAVTDLLVADPPLRMFERSLRDTEHPPDTLPAAQNLKGRPMKTVRLLLLALLLATPPALANADQNMSTDSSAASGKIYGGSQSKAGDWPWITALLKSNRSDMYNAQFCAGVLIDSTWVLTAAHCVYDMTAAEVDVAVGAYGLSSFSGVRIPVKNIRVHPQYNSSNSVNDIALLELSLADSGPVATLFSGESKENAPPSLLGQMTTAMGWGMADINGYWRYPEILRQVNLPVVDNSYCNRIYKTILAPSQICAGYYEGKDVCNGDSGGPIVTQIDGVWVHAGLVSYGAPCADYLGWYGVYTRTSAYVDYIRGYVPNAKFTSLTTSSGNLQWMMLLIDKQTPAP